MSSQTKFLEALDSWANAYMYRSMTDYFDYLKNTRVSMQQAYALTYIYYHGRAKISDICEHMLVSPAAASQMVDRLEKSGLVERTLEPDDRRVRNVALSAEGESFVSGSIAARQNWVKEIPAELSDAQLDEIAKALNRLVRVTLQQADPRMASR